MEHLLAGGLREIVRDEGEWGSTTAKSGNQALGHQLHGRRRVVVDQSIVGLFHDSMDRTLLWIHRHVVRRTGLGCEHLQERGPSRSSWPHQRHQPRGSSGQETRPPREQGLTSDQKRMIL